MPLELIQTVRVAHALMETDFLVQIDPADKVKFTALQKRFDLRFTVDRCRPVHFLCPCISHSKPAVAIGGIERPLLFPQSIFDFCRKRWPEQRENYYSFAGLVTENRIAVLTGWLTRHFAAQSLRLKGDSSLANLPSLDRKISLESGGRNIEFRSSTRGRNFPIKSWDEEYYLFLLNSNFVLCPDGDYTWTYRFFESVMCGAIPIVQTKCASYKGYQFHSMTDDISWLKYSRTAAIANFELCKKQMSVSPDELNAELEAICRDNPPSGGTSS
jgi:hypothetical protein